MRLAIVVVIALGYFGNIHANDFTLSWEHSSVAAGSLVSCKVTGATTEPVVHDVPPAAAGDILSSLSSDDMPELVEDTQYDCEVRSYTAGTVEERSTSGPSNVLRFWNELARELVSVPRAPEKLEVFHIGG